MEQHNKELLETIYNKFLTTDYTVLILNKKTIVEQINIKNALLIYLSYNFSLNMGNEYFKGVVDYILIPNDEIKLDMDNIDKFIEIYSYCKYNFKDIIIKID